MQKDEGSYEALPQALYRGGGKTRSEQAPSMQSMNSDRVYFQEGQGD